jgi:hypothetical protein
MLGITLVAGMLSVIGGSVYAMGAWRSRVVSVKTEVATTQPVYVCLECQALSMKAGSCAICKKDLQERHLLGTQGGQALLCNCATDCRCAAEDIVGGKCPCNKDVVTIAAKGMYVCPKGCQFISETAGKCGCGKKLKRVGAAVAPL